MKKVSPDELKPGMVVGQDTAVVKKGAKLDEDIIESIKKGHIKELVVYDEQSPVEEAFDIEKLEKIYESIPYIVEENKFEEWTNKLSYAFDNIETDKGINEVNKITENIYKNFFKGSEQILKLFKTYEDKGLLYHSVNTAILSAMLATVAGMPYVFSKQVIKLSLLHDVGYIFLGERIIVDYEDTSDDKYRLHNIVGYKKLEKVKDLIEFEVWEGILKHHERYDGRGELGLKGEAIPAIVRLFQVCDAYTSLLELDYPPYSAFSWILSRSGKLFDPYYVGLFYSMSGYYPTGTKVVLSNGEIGVVYSKGERELFPKVKLESGRIIDTNPQEGIYVKEVIDI